ncbi:MAG: hypothetical protein BWY76_02029 [bacterium ADurb.Bin429]|nr:MAG: hypothetical protein BWY76_02029 [bacterium ADurb.Bin429]
MDGLGVVAQVVLLGAVWGQFVLALLVFGFMFCAMVTQALIGLVTLSRKAPHPTKG